MTIGMNEQNAQLLDLLEKSGMREQLEARVEAQNFEKRRQLIAERKRLLDEADRALPPLDAAVAEAREAVALLEQKLTTARQVMHYAQQRAYGMRGEYGTAAIDADIARHAPRFLQDGYDSLQEALDFLRGTVRYWSQRQRVGWNFVNVDKSNGDDVALLRTKCVSGRDEIESMMFDDKLSIDEMRARCQSIVDECVALTRPHLQGDKLWQTHQERKARAQRKSA